MMCEPFSAAELKQWLDQTRERVIGRCGTCKFFDPDGQPVKQDSPYPGLVAIYFGKCRFNAPRAYSEILVDDDERIAEWPGVSWNDWCGEHKQAQNHLWNQQSDRGSEDHGEDPNDQA